eukprot:5433313-Pyramimonas_sp.AAC.1
MRGREANDTLFRSPAGHPVPMNMKKATANCDSQVKQQGSGHQLGSLYLHAFASLLECLKDTNAEGKPDEIKVSSMATGRLHKVAVDKGQASDMEDFVHSCRVSD